MPNHNTHMSDPDYDAMTNEECEQWFNEIRARSTQPLKRSNTHLARTPSGNSPGSSSSSPREPTSPTTIRSKNQTGHREYIRTPFR